MNHGHVLVKVYGHMWPACPALLEALRHVMQGLPLGDIPPDETLELDGDLLRLSYEGVYFPLDDVLAVIAAHLSPDSQGKLDYLDMEGWTLHRHRIVQGQLQASSASLNAVLDYSGH